jgi:hypothetical protein
MDDGRKPAFFAETLNIMVSPTPSIAESA